MRHEEKLFIAEGEKIVHEFLNSDFRVKTIYAMRTWLDKNRSLCLKKSVQAEEITTSELKQISTLTTPNEALALVYFKPESAADFVPRKGVYLALDGIRDPGNMGTLIRTADWFGVSGIICSTDCVDIYNPKVVQATMGSLAHIRVQYVDLENFLGKKENLPVYAATLKGKNIFAQKFPADVILLVGNESAGISQGLLKIADAEVSIPKYGKAESLNVSIAAGVMLSWLKKG